MKPSIIYEDNHLLVVEKPMNILVQADSTGDIDFLTMLKDFIKIRDNKPGNVYLGLVHRLDRPVGGVMVYAKTSKAASRLSEQIRKQEIKRYYLAVVIGLLENNQGMLEDYLWKNRDKNQVYIVNKDHPQGKLAQLKYQVVSHSASHTLIKVELLTGRSHQIRVQLANFGYPLYGDQKYGGQKVSPNTQIALWSHKLILTHPITKDILAFNCPIPTCFPWSSFNLDSKKSLIN